MTTANPSHHCNQPNRRLHSPIGYIKNYFQNKFKEYLPRRLKRMMFLASIAAVLYKTVNVDQQALDKLNKILRMGYNNDGMAFPIYIHSWIWKDLLDDPKIQLTAGCFDVDDLNTVRLSADDYVTIAKRFEEKAPQWLIYGSTRLLSDDLYMLFNCLAV